MNCASVWLALLCVALCPVASLADPVLFSLRTGDVRFSESQSPYVTVGTQEVVPLHAESGCCSLSGYFEQKAQGLAATRTAFSLDFPFTFAQRVFWDTGYLLTAPGRWDRQDWTRFSLFAAATGGMMGLDRQIDIESRVRHPRSASERDVEDGLQNLGDLPGTADDPGDAYALGLLTGNDEASRLATDAGEALVISGLVFTQSLKEVVGRSRPRVAEGPFHFAPFSGSASFPSGHTTAAFTMAAVIAEHAENNLWIAVPTYGLASMVAVARVRADAHFASDVLVGAVLGIVTARTVVRLEKQRLTQCGDGSTEVAITPLVGADVRGVQVTVRF